MGYLTTITIHNDALGTFKKHPKEFAEAIFLTINFIMQAVFFIQEAKKLIKNRKRNKKI